MSKWILITILILVCIPLVSASEDDICEETLPSGSNCTMLTPSIDYCLSYNYTIYNQTDFIKNGSLTLLNNSIYYFLFNESKGDYIVQLCDDSTREIIVEMGDSMMIAIAIILSIFGVFFIFIGLSMLRGNNHNGKE